MTEIAEVRKQVEELQGKVADLRKEMSQLNRLFYLSVSLTRRFGLPENIDKALAKVQAMVTGIYGLITAYRAFQVATGPLGLAVATLGFIASSFIAAQSLYEYEGR